MFDKQESAASALASLSAFGSYEVAYAKMSSVQGFVMAVEF